MGCHVTLNVREGDTARHHSTETDRPPRRGRRHSLPMEHRQASPPTRRPKASMGEGGLTVDATIDGGS
eukprot:1344990-Prymnesium_polylepis.1